MRFGEQSPLPFVVRLSDAFKQFFRPLLGTVPAITAKDAAA